MRVPCNWFSDGGERAAADRPGDSTVRRTERIRTGRRRGADRIAVGSGPAALPRSREIRSAAPHRAATATARHGRRNDNAVGDDVRGRSRRVRTDKQPSNDNNITNAPIFFFYRKRIPKRFLYSLSHSCAKYICARRGFHLTRVPCTISRLSRTRGLRHIGGAGAKGFAG